MSGTFDTWYRVSGRELPARLDVYPVGLLRDWRHGRRWRGVKRVLVLVRAGEWRSARMSLNGYLAENPEHVPGTWRCGRGWTRGAAVRSWRRHANRNAL